MFSGPTSAALKEFPCTETLFWPLRNKYTRLLESVTSGGLSEKFEEVL